MQVNLGAFAASSMLLAVWSLTHAVRTRFVLLAGLPAEFVEFLRGFRLRLVGCLTVGLRQVYVGDHSVYDDFCLEANMRASRVDDTGSGLNGVYAGLCRVVWASRFAPCIRKRDMLWT